MHPVRRSRFIAAGAAAFGSVAFVRFPGDAAEFTYKLSSNIAPTHPINTSTAKAAEEIKRLTKGRLEIQLFPSSQLGTDADVFSQLRAGAVQFFMWGGANIATLAPLATINSIPFAFKNLSDVFKAMDGDVGKIIREDVSKRSNGTLFLFEKCFDNGFRQITSSDKPIKSAADIKGFKIRVPPNPMSASIFQSLGALPVSMSFSEVYTGLQTKLISGQENPLGIIEAGKLYEVQKFVSQTNHQWDGFWLIANAASFKALPKDIQSIVNAQFIAAAEADRPETAKLNDVIMGRLKQQGMTFVEADQASFRDGLKAAKFYPEWKAKYGNAAWAVLEKYSGRLG